MAFDLTNIGVNAPREIAQPHTASVRQSASVQSPIQEEEGGQIYNDQKVKEIARHTKGGLWTIDKGIDDGQVAAGDVDREQQEFLKNTTFVE